MFKNYWSANIGYDKIYGMSQDPFDVFHDKILWQGQNFNDRKRKIRKYIVS